VLLPVCWAERGCSPASLPHPWRQLPRLVASGARLWMPCAKCAKKQSGKPVRRRRPSAVAPARLVSLERVLTAPARPQLACPDKWKDGSREQSSGGRKLNVNKLLLKRPGCVAPSTTTQRSRCVSGAGHGSVAVAGRDAELPLCVAAGSAPSARRARARCTSRRLRTARGARTPRASAHCAGRRSWTRRSTSSPSERWLCTRPAAAMRAVRVKHVLGAEWDCQTSRAYLRWYVASSVTAYARHASCAGG